MRVDEGAEFLLLRWPKGSRREGLRFPLLEGHRDRGDRPGTFGLLIQQEIDGGVGIRFDGHRSAHSIYDAQSLAIASLPVPSRKG